MKIYIALVEDDSADTEVHPFLMKMDAVNYCMTKAAEYAHLSSDIEDHTHPDEILCLHYHPEGNKITVTEEELNIPSNMFVHTGFMDSSSGYDMTEVGCSDIDPPCDDDCDTCEFAGGCSDYHKDKDKG